MNKTIAVLGSCVSRDNFNSIFNPNHKQFFNCVLYHHQSSILSLMSEPLATIHEQYGSGKNDFWKWHLRTEFNKEFLGALKERKPDFLIIDFFGDIYYSVYKLDKDNYLTENPNFMNLPYFKDKTNKINIKDNYAEFLSVWKKKIHEFFSFVKSNSPNTKIILNKAKLVDKFKNGISLTEERKKANIRAIDVDEMNRLWDILNQYVIENFDVIEFNLFEKEYFLNETHPWGKFYVHYTMNFYHDFFNKLQYLVIREMDNQRANAQKEVQELKLTLIQKEKDLSNFKTSNKKLKKKVNFYEKETFTHSVKRHLLKINVINRLNDAVKGR
ncbi:hypothetical protein K3L72_18460 [Bacillus altitudinis]|uniref:DUF6270 domain-containing protein n=1 Tax=Bacillus altitudinis TaxID=293387 RepID=UPI00148EB89B|nr:DUF6270 domain-containing protein [Bacillus altitudinis]MCW4359751.1 hypothetical protein [Bacillus altitudinis]NOL33976.1 hypothetical protein [Bacillus altitudinis]WJE29538.1 DUF6270 domain-containing protein [Bacillus altitudinis]